MDPMIGDIAAYITILDALGRGITYGQRVMREALRATARTLEDLNPSPGGDPRAVVTTVLSRKLDLKHLAIVQQDLRYIEPIRLHLCRIISTSSSLAPTSYAVALEGIAAEIGRQLEDFKAFNLLGRHLNTDSTCLALPNTWSAIRFFSSVSRQFRLPLGLIGMIDLVRGRYSSPPPHPQFYFYMAIHVGVGRGKYEEMRLCSCNDFQFYFTGDGRLVKGPIPFSHDNKTQAKPGEPAVALCTMRHIDFARFLRGLLLDYSLLGPLYI